MTRLPPTCAILVFVQQPKPSLLAPLSSPNNVIAALAIDQRSSLRKLLAAAAQTTPSQVTDHHLATFKHAVVRHLSPLASAVLIDPEFGLSALPARHPSTGLLLTYESDGFENPRPHRMLQLMPDFSVLRLKSLGAQGVKILLSWDPDGDPDANLHKQALIERIGAECAAHSLPFFLEPVVYNYPSPAAKAAFVTRTVHEFSKPQYQASVLKIEFPASASDVANGLLSLPLALDAFKRTDDAALVPYIFLSAGVSIDNFTASLDLALQARSRFAGVLCGRAHWQLAALPFMSHGPDALADWLASQGARNMAAVNSRLGWSPQ